MTREEIIEKLMMHKGTESLNLVTDLLKIRRSKHRDSLESSESLESRGRSLECRDLLKILK